MKLPSSLASTPTGEVVTNPTQSGYVVKRPYPVKGKYTYWFSKNAPWLEAWDHPYFIFDVNGGTRFIYHYPDSIHQNDYPGSAKSGQGTFTIPANQYATVTYNAGNYISRFLIWITNRWGVAGGCNIELYLDPLAPNAPGNFGVINPVLVDNKYYTNGTVTLGWDPAVDEPQTAKADYEASGINGYKIFEIINNDEVDITPNGGYITGNSEQIALSEGAHIIKIKAYDNETNESLPAGLDHEIMVDQTPPPCSASNIRINDNSGYTNNPDGKVTLFLSNLKDNSNGIGLKEVGISNDDENYIWYACPQNQSAIPVSKTIEDWELADSSMDGSKTVYLKLRDKLDNETTTAVTKTITLDRTPPTGSIVINAGAPITYDQEVTLTLSATDALSGVKKIKFSNDSNVTANFSSDYTYEPEITWTLSDNNESGTNKTKTVYAIFFDGAGNQSGAEMDTIVYEDHPDFTDPTPITTLADDETWSQDQTIYGQLIVPAGKKLIIGPNVTVTIDGPANSDPDQNGLIVEGELEVQNGATFVKASTKISWMGIVITGTGSINGANISGAERGLAILSGALNVSISGCALSQNFIGIHV